MLQLQTMMLRNNKKTVCMVFNPEYSSKIIAMHFPNFTINGQQLEFAQEFKYLGHMLENRLFIFVVRWEIYFCRCNILVLSRRFYSCLLAVKKFCSKVYILVCTMQHCGLTLPWVHTGNWSQAVKCIKMFFFNTANITALLICWMNCAYQTWIL